MIFEDEGEVGQQFRAAIEAQGGVCVSIQRAPAMVEREGDQVVGGTDAASLRAVLDGLSAGSAAPITGLVSFWGLDSTRLDPATTTALDLEAALDRGCGATLALVQAAETAASGARLWLVTAGAQAVGAGETVANPTQATIWGLGRSVRWERGDAWGGLVDLDPTDPAGSVPGLVAAVLDREADDEQAVRFGVRFMPRLVRSEPPAAPTAPLAIRAEASYLITGGLGDLGLKAAAWLVDRGARRLVLVGRRGLPPRATWIDLPADHGSRPTIAAIEALERLGATVLVAAADIADEAQIQGVLDRVGEVFPPIRGIIHAAGLVGPGAARDTSLGALQAILRPKIVGTWVLHRTTRHLPLDFLVPFSSVAAVFGAKEVAYLGGEWVP